MNFYDESKMKHKNLLGFYHNLVTQKSWHSLQELRKKYDFILIGGWAVFLYAHTLKSKDIDLVMDYPELEKLREEVEVYKNDRLKKYEARKDEVEIDIYIPFYSNPGLPAEDLKHYSISLEGFRIVEKEILAILKQKALMERAHSVKGRKDLIDLVSLFMLNDFDWGKYKIFISQYQLGEYLQFTSSIIKMTKKIDELDLNVHRLAGLKKKILSFMIKTA